MHRTVLLCQRQLDHSGLLLLPLQQPRKDQLPQRQLGHLARLRQMILQGLMVLLRLLPLGLRGLLRQMLRLRQKDLSLHFLRDR